MLNIINIDDTKMKKDSRNYVKINPKLGKRYTRIKNSNLYRDDEFYSNSNFSTFKNLTSINNSIIEYLFYPIIFLKK